MGHHHLYLESECPQVPKSSHSAVKCVCWSSLCSYTPPQSHTLTHSQINTKCCSGNCTCINRVGWCENGATQCCETPPTLVQTRSSKIIPGFALVTNTEATIKSCVRCVTFLHAVRHKTHQQVSVCSCTSLCAGFGVWTPENTQMDRRGTRHLRLKVPWGWK